MKHKLAPMVDSSINLLVTVTLACAAALVLGAISVLQMIGLWMNGSAFTRSTPTKPTTSSLTARQVPPWRQHTPSFGIN